MKQQKTWKDGRRGGIARGYAAEVRLGRARYLTGVNRLLTEWTNLSKLSLMTDLKQRHARGKKRDLGGKKAKLAANQAAARWKGAN